jgi:hypothetical protein
MQPDSEKDPAVLLPYLLGRRLRAEEVYEAFGLKKSTYYENLAKGTLTTADRLIAVARHFGLNPVNLLIYYGHITRENLFTATVEVVQSAEEVAELGKSLATSGRRGLLDRLINVELARQPGINPL